MEILIPVRLYQIIFYHFKLEILKQTLDYIYIFFLDYYIYILKLSIKQFVISIYFSMNKYC
jgi:hypothetical protein